MNKSKFPTKRLCKLTGHNGPVQALTYSSHPSTYILTGSTDKRIRLFNPSRASPTSTGLIQTYTGHGYDVADLAVSNDNTAFLSCGGDKLVFVWDVATARTTRRFEGHVGRVNAVAWGGEGDSVAVSGSFDATVRLWDLKSKSYKPIMTFSEGKDSISSVEVRGPEVWSGSIDGRVRGYDVRMGRVLVDVIGYPITSLTPTKQSETLLLSTLNSSLHLLDKSTGSILKSYKSPTFKNETYRIRSTLGLNDAVALSGSEDGNVYVWDLVDGDVLHVLRHGEEIGAQSPSDKEGKRDVVSVVAFCEGRREWCSGGGDGQVVVWGVDGG
ncbi:WD domain protein [Tothia fuscella]|uniref:WD domain protein n=1 Tax=Tothia fuscella TaxID=1048955 RepID=A0A9P4NIB4_9PEZI|nr:WD domain protein [Tothia fuscella]